MAVTRGFYEHYKGNTYFVHGLAKVEATGEVVVVYESADGKAWTRPVSDFVEHVVVKEWDPLTHETFTKEVPRFKKVL